MSMYNYCNLVNDLIFLETINLCIATRTSVSNIIALSYIKVCFFIQMTRDTGNPSELLVMFIMFFKSKTRILFLKFLLGSWLTFWSMNVHRYFTGCWLHVGGKVILLLQPATKQFVNYISETFRQFQFPCYDEFLPSPVSHEMLKEPLTIYWDMHKRMRMSFNIYGITCRESYIPPRGMHMILWYFPLDRPFDIIRVWCVCEGHLSPEFSWKK